LVKNGCSQTVVTLQPQIPWSELPLTLSMDSKYIFSAFHALINASCMPLKWHACECVHAHVYDCRCVMCACRCRL